METGAKPSNEYAQYRPKGKRWKAYCGIDVGSISCGYAYSFRDTDHIWDNSNWADDQCYFSQRAPSALLYGSNKLPLTFGFDACERYILMSQEEKEDVTFEYDGLLHHGETSVEREIKNLANSAASEETGSSVGSSGGSYASSDDCTQQIREAVLNHYADLALLLGRHCKGVIEETYKSLKRTPDEIVWSFVVPLAWDTECKSCYIKKIKELYLREYSEEFAGQRYKIKVVTSTEALWFSTRDEMKKVLKRDKLSLKKDPTKREKAVLYVHSGAIKTELSLHKKKLGRVPLTTATVEAGGHCCNKVLEALVTECLDSQGSTLVELQENHTSAWLQMLLTFENAKVAIPEGDIALDTSYNLSEVWYKLTNNRLEEVLKESESTGKASLPLVVSGMAKLIPDMTRLQSANKEAASTIIRAVKEMMLGNIVEVTCIVLTGGFGGSSFVRRCLFSEQEKGSMQPVRLRTPDHTAMILARGAVMVAKEDCYKKVANSFVVHWYHKMDASHPKPLKMINGHKVLEKVYPILHKGEDIEVGRSFQIGPFHLNDFYHQHVWFDIYRLSRNLDVLKSPTCEFYETDYIKGEDKIARLKVTVPPIDYGKTHVLYVIVSLDLLGFKAGLILSSSPLTERHSVMCKYI